MAASQAYSTEPPVIRERYRTVDLEDDDIVETKLEPAPLRKSTPPPAPPARRSTVPPPPASMVVTKPVVAAAPVAVPAPAAVPAIAATPAIVAVPAIAPPRAASAPDPTDILFDAVYELNFATSTWEAAGMCAQTLARALGARAVVVHTHDLERRELRAIGAHGDADVEVIGMSESSEDDLVASAVLVNQKSVTMRFDGELPRIAPKRLHAVGAPRSVVAVPALAWGRCLAIIEVIDADERYDGRVADSAAYVAERLAEFLADNAA